MSGQNKKFRSKSIGNDQDAKKVLENQSLVKE